MSFFGVIGIIVGVIFVIYVIYWVLKLVLAGKKNRTIRDTPEGAIIYATVEAFGYYDGSDETRILADQVFYLINGYEGDSFNDSQQYELYWKTLKGEKLYIPLAAMYAVSVFTNPLQLGINVNSKEWIKNRRAFSLFYPFIGDFLINEGVKLKDYDRVLSCMAYLHNLHVTTLLTMASNQ
jgi:hypothetical protein